jgi:hypothetical protein
MGKVVNISEAAKRRQETVEDAWERFKSAMLKSKETLDIRDGIAAGKAYRQFLEACAKGGL